MKRSLILAALVAASLTAAVAAAVAPTVSPEAFLTLALFGPLVLFMLAVVGPLNASRERLPKPRNGRGLPHWLTVALYRVAKFGAGMRDKLGAAMFAWQVRTGAILCAFQSTVGADIGLGVVGEFYLTGPTRTQPARISHGTPADIVVGRWFTLAADGSARPGGAGAIGGVFCNPKTLASIGTSAGGPLAPTLTVPTGTVGEFCYMGEIIVAAPAAVALGAAAKYDTTTGVIGVGAPGGGEAAIPNSRFVRFVNAAAGLAVLELTN